ncbi:MAG: hypothetical protein K5931_05550 [Lachnospiraceae bacterium]|nr:hypothetical protein [Lachnospiraceae bacterium]
MDKYEYQVCADQIKSLIAERRFVEAMDIADTIDWRRVKSVSMLCTVSEIYKINKHYEESRDILLLAYERYPNGRTIVYALCELSVKMRDLVQAIEYYKEFMRIAPGDSGSYILLYKIYTGQGVSLEERIEVLEEFKRRDYREKWAYELAYLYHLTGQETKCIQECDELILWFGDGKYVKKALELKMQHTGLTAAQEAKYKAISPPDLDLVKSYENNYSPDEDKEKSASKEDEELSDEVDEDSPEENTSDISVSEEEDNSKSYSTLNLQNELQKNVENYFADDSKAIKEIVLKPISEEDIKIKRIPDIGFEKTREFNIDPEFIKNALAGENMGKEEGEASEGPDARGERRFAEDTDEIPIFNELKNRQLKEEESEEAASGDLEEKVSDPGDEREKYGRRSGKDFSIELTSDVEGLRSSVKPIESVTEEAVWITEVEELSDKEDEELEEPEELPEEDGFEVEEVISKRVPKGDTKEIIIHDTKEIPDAVKELAEGYEKSGKKHHRGKGKYKAKRLQAAAAAAAEAEALKQKEDFSEEFLEEDEATNMVNNAPKALDNKERDSKEELNDRPEKDDNERADNRAAWGIDDDPLPKQTYLFLPGGKYNDLLGEEYDGQITMSSLLDGDMVERQITGQINVKEFLREIREKKANRRKVKEKKDLSRTEDLYNQLKDVLPSIKEDKLKDIEESRARGKNEFSEEGALSGGEAKESFKNTDESSPNKGEDGDAETDRLAREVEMALEEENDSKPLEEKPKELFEEDAIEEPDYPEDEEELFETEEDLDELYEEEEPSEAEEKKEDKGDPLGGGSFLKDIDEEEKDKEDEKPKKPSLKDDTSEIRAGFSFDLDDYGEVEELEDITQPDEVDDIISTNNLPIDKIAAEYDAIAEQAYFTDSPVDGSRGDNSGREKHPSYMVLEDEVKSKRDFTEDEMKLFGRYNGIEPLKAQLVDALDDMDMAAGKGNVVVMGPEGTGRKNLAIDLVKAMQLMDSKFLGKVAKISGEALNKKNIPSTLRKLTDGALIVEDAGGLNADTMAILGETLVTSDEKVMVVLEGTKESLQPILDSNKPLLEVVFDARVIIETFSNDDLVAYAKGYAREQEHSMDEMGILALYTKLNDMQTLDHKVTIDEVRELVDGAIEHVDKKTFSHFLDLLFSRRYDDNDCIIIREKDFNYNK